jgi:hypothetical protein
MDFQNELFSLPPPIWTCKRTLAQPIPWILILSHNLL